MREIDEWLKDNYRQVRAERGLTWAEMAREVGTADPSLAAWMRSEDQPAQPQRAVRPERQQERRPERRPQDTRSRSWA